VVVVGVPRALLYYVYFPFWRRFFAELGVEVVLSAPTCEDFFTAGAKAVVDEVCAPVKIAMGHILSLAPHVDYVLVPRFVSVEPCTYICPKLMGLPDMIRHNGLKMPPLLAPDIDLSRGYLGLGQVFTETSRVLGKGWWESGRAFYRALPEVSRTRRQLMTGLTPEEAFHGTLRRHQPGRRLRIALLGHPYSIYDPLLSMNIIERLRSLDVDVVTAEMLPDEHIALGLARLQKKLFWTLSKMVLGAGLYFLHHDSEVEGIIVMSSFGCGLESLVGDMLERFARRKEFPMLHLTVDEHSAEAGLVTRLEAFVETVRGRTRHAHHLSPYGNAQLSNASAP